MQYKPIAQFLDAGQAWRWLITLLFAGMIGLLSIAPGRMAPGDSVFSWLVVNTSTPVQKILHLGIYAVMAFLWMWTLQPVPQKWLRIVLALVLSVGLGAGLEAWQTRVPGRYGTLTDVILNGIGAAIGLIAALALL